VGEQVAARLNWKLKNTSQMLLSKLKKPET
jgi:hypothetical protein